jgi:hypothetical protein
MGLAPRCVTLGLFSGAQWATTKFNRTKRTVLVTLTWTRHSVPVCGWPLQRGWRMRRLVSSRRPELKIPDTSQRALAASLPVRYGFLVQFPVAQTERLLLAVATSGYSIDAICAGSVSCSDSIPPRVIPTKNITASNTVAPSFRGALSLPICLSNSSWSCRSIFTSPIFVDARPQKHVLKKGAWPN